MRDWQLKIKARKQFQHFAESVFMAPRQAALFATFFVDFLTLFGIFFVGAYLSDGVFAFNLIILDMYLLAAFSAAVCVWVFLATGMYRPMLRYNDAVVIFPILGSTICAGLLVSLVVTLWCGEPAINIFIGIGWFFAVGGLHGWRLVAVALLNKAGRSKDEVARHVIIYGAGRAGAAIGEALTQGTNTKVYCYADDNRNLHGRTLNGAKIVSPIRIDELVNKGKVDLVVLALPATSTLRRAAIINQLAELPVRVETAPTLEEMLVGGQALTDIRGVSAEELLSRDPVTPDLQLVTDELRSKTVLVTGGGGSIGSAICRAVIAHQPAKLIIFEQSEFALYSIERELREWLMASSQPVQLVPLLGSTLDKGVVERIFDEHVVDIVYHAAAYKHVPLVEMNPVVGAANNILGTYHVASAAHSRKVGKFVLISTDKAVRPTNVMGASKRVGERLVQAFGHESPDTGFVLVRFGNVLDSAGSAVPLFREQIARGGPVTITDPDVERYFMTIPEAAELVIQAGAMGAGGGEIFHLDMGEPVKVADLARKLIHLSGLRVREPGHRSGDIEIKFVGLRPGEKLVEELLVDE
ncbi:MAG TPA: hypothetical protein DIT40_12665, partial [Alphaproteobacteria bacterium]|nr:hypothetical protein [Alphaproteobacteria bacterium]